MAVSRRNAGSGAIGGEGFAVALVRKKDGGREACVRRMKRERSTGRFLLRNRKGTPKPHKLNVSEMMCVFLVACTLRLDYVAVLAAAAAAASAGNVFSMSDDNRKTALSPRDCPTLLSLAGLTLPRVNFEVLV